MKTSAAALCFVIGVSGVALGQGLVNFANTSSTTIRTNALSLGGTAGKTAPQAGGFYYALFTAPSTVTSLTVTDLLSTTWTFTGLYATNILSTSGGRLAGGMGVATLQGWDPGTTNSFAIAGWSAGLAGRDWSAVAPQLAGAYFDQGIWVAPNWTSGNGFFGFSTVGYGVAGGGPGAIPPCNLFGASTLYALPLSSGFDLYPLTDSAPGGIAPQFTTQPTNLTVLAGDNATFTSQASGTPPPSYQWKKNGADISGATNPTLTLANVQPADAGPYTVDASNSGGATRSSTATLTVISVPVITSQPQNLSLDPGTTATFTVTASGPGTLTYQWRFNGTSISSATSSNYSIGSAQPSDSGYYTVVVGNSYGSVTSSAAILRVPQQGTVNFINSYQTQIRTNAMGVGGTVDNTAPYNAGVGFYYALFTASPTITNIDPADLLGPNWTLTGLYATNTIAAGRLNGGMEAMPLRGWPPQVTNSFVIAGWSSDVAGQDWSAVASQLSGAWLANGVWYGSNWLSSSQSGFFGISAVGYGQAGGGIRQQPPFTLFGIVANSNGVPVKGFDLYAIRRGPGPMAALVEQSTLAPDGFHLLFSGEPGHVYQVLVSSNYTHWDPIGIVTNTDGQIRFVDPIAGSAPRAYRALQLQ